VYLEYRLGISIMVVSQIIGYYEGPYLGIVGYVGIIEYLLIKPSSLYTNMKQH